MFTNLKSVAAFVAVILILLSTQHLATQAQTFSGQATALRATVTTGLAPAVSTAVSDTGPLPSAGGVITLGSASANVTNVLTAGASTVGTSGSGTSAQSTASIATLDMAVLGAPNAVRVRADAVASTTTCTCGNIQCSGSSTITNLRTGPGAGSGITVSGAPNQTVIITSGVFTLTIVINEQIVSPTAMTVNAIHITLVNSTTSIRTDVVVSSSHSDIACTPAPSFDRYSGRATGVRLATSTLIPQSSLATIVSDTGFLPTSGGNINVTTTSVNVVGLLSTGVVTSNTSGGLPGGSEDTSQSDSTVNNLGVSLVGAVNITATVLDSDTVCTCGVTPPVSCIGDSDVAGLAVTIGGIPFVIVVDGSVNQTIPLPAGLGTIIINEQIAVGANDITVNALHVILTPLGLASTDLVIASSHSDIHCGLAPTSASASVSGRVLRADGLPVANARVSMTNQDGKTLTAMTNLLGHYTIDQVPVGETYQMEVSHRRYRFAPRTVRLEDNVAGVDFTAEE